MTALRVPVQPGKEYIGVRFLPGAAGPLLALDVKTTRNALIPFDRADFAAAMRSAGLDGMDALLLEWVASARWHGPDPAVAELVRRILETQGTAPVSALVAGLNLSYRQLLRRFYEAAGLTLKEFARLRRLRAACLEALRCAEPGWAGLSANAGFSDQSHLVREFQDIYGWSPRLIHEYLRRIEHLDVRS
jgi:AraC-like DNA-binding protein